MDRICSTYGEVEMRTFYVVNLKVRDGLGNVGINGRIILKWIIKKLVVRL